MGEFANKLRKQAAQTLRALHQEEVASGTDPLVELIGFLLEDGAGGVLWRASAPVTTPQWLTWNQLILNRQDEVVQTVTNVLEAERTQLPTEVEAMREWAAWLLLSTLDRMGML